MVWTAQDAAAAAEMILTDPGLEGCSEVIVGVDLGSWYIRPANANGEFEGRIRSEEELRAFYDAGGEFPSWTINDMEGNGDGFKGSEDDAINEARRQSVQDRAHYRVSDSEGFAVAIIDPDGKVWRVTDTIAGRE